MSYKQYTIRSASEQTAHQWINRDLAGELQLCERRVLGPLFERHLPRDGVICEAGCGIGGWVKQLGRAGYEVVGIDWYPAVVQAAKTTDPTLPVEVGDVRGLRFADGQLAAYI